MMTKISKAVHYYFLNIYIKTKKSITNTKKEHFCILNFNRKKSSQTKNSKIHNKLMESKIIFFFKFNTTEGT